MAETFIPNMPYYHCRTERWMDVICPGYTGDVSAKPSKYKCFSEFRPHAFNEFRKEFIEEAGLAYSGGTELFLLYAEVGEKIL